MGRYWRSVKGKTQILRSLILNSIGQSTWKFKLSQSKIIIFLHFLCLNFSSLFGDCALVCQGRRPHFNNFYLSAKMINEGRTLSFLHKSSLQRLWAGMQISFPNTTAQYLSFASYTSSVSSHENLPTDIILNYRVSLKYFGIRSMCLELQFSRPRWRWVSAATIASDRYVWSC